MSRTKLRSILSESTRQRLRYDKLEIAGAEIVDGDLHAEVAQRRQRILAEFAGAILEQRAFGELELR